MSTEACRKYLAERTAKNPTHADNWNHLAIVLESMGRYEEALNAVDRALSIHPGFRAARITRAFLLSDTGQGDAAIREFRDLGGGELDEFDTVFSLGILSMRHGWQETGLSQLCRAEALRPHAPYVVAYLAAALQEVGETSAAYERSKGIEAALKQRGVDDLVPGLGILVSDPNFYGRWDNPFLAKVPIFRAHVLRAAGEEKAAQEELLYANRHLPGYSPLVVAMARDFLASDRIDEARRWLSASILMSDDDSEARCELAFLHARLGDIQAAQTELQASVSLRPLFPDLRYHLGLLLLELGRNEEAAHQFERALVLKPDYGQCAIHFASLELQRGEARKALKRLNADGVASWPEAQLLAATAQLQLGEKQLATGRLKAALVTDPANEEVQHLLRSLEVEV